MSLFDCIHEAPRDPILGLTELFNADKNPTKINLGVGVYFTNEGKIPLLESVQIAEKLMLETPKPRSYLPIQGADTYCMGVQQLLFGDDSNLREKIVTVQTLGGTGALKIGADFLKRFFPQTTVAISDPSWENHRALFESAGFPVSTYTYYDPTTQRINFTGLLASLKALPSQSIVVLHACCHNPTGLDLSHEQWLAVIEICKTQALIPFLDMAYQGFANDVETDATVVRLFAQSGLAFLIANSFSKSFSLYGERVGGLSIITNGKDEATCVLSQIKRVIRTNYSNPPTHGGAIISTILTHPELRALWEKELGEMRCRIQTMRHTLVEKLKPLSHIMDFSFINQQQGMFSYSGLNKEQAQVLMTKHGIYILPTGRICIAALNTENIDRVVYAIADILGYHDAN